MKALTHNIQQEREDQRDRSAQLFMWCIVVSMHQDDGIGASRLLRACNEMDAFEKKYQTAILYGSSKNATDAMRENLKGICDFEVRLPVDRAPRGRREEQLRMASNQGAEIAWLVMAATCHETFGYGRDRLARLKQNSMNNYKQYLEWEKEDKDLALDRLRRCVQDALKEDLRVTDTDDRKGMLSTPGRGPSVYETAAVYSEIFRRARAGGTAGKNAEKYSVNLPAVWLRAMGLSKEDRVELSFDGEKITIRPLASTDSELFRRNAEQKGHRLKEYRYYDGDTLCTVILADFTAEQICIENKVDEILDTAFGVNETPSWEDFLAFLADRCIPKTRKGLDYYLDAVGVPEYDPVQLVEKTQGRMAEDHKWLEII